MKKQQNVILRYSSLKISCDEIIKATGFILLLNMSGVPIKFFPLLLICKYVEQRLLRLGNFP